MKQDGLIWTDSSTSLNHAIIKSLGEVIRKIVRDKKHFFPLLSIVLSLLSSLFSLPYLLPSLSSLSGYHSASPCTLWDHAQKHQDRVTGQDDHNVENSRRLGITRGKP